LAFTYETTVSNARTAVANDNVVNFEDSFGQPVTDPLNDQLLSGSVSNPPLANGVFVQNQMNGSIAHRFGRTTGTFSILQNHWDYQATDLQIDQTQGNLALRRTLSSRASGSLGLQYWIYDQSSANQNDFDQYQLTAQWSYRLNANLHSSVSYLYSQRSSDSSALDFDQNQIWLTLNWTRGTD